MVQNNTILFTYLKENINPVLAGRRPSRGEGLYAGHITGLSDFHPPKTFPQ
jgi:hypothetical protein